MHSESHQAKFAELFQAACNSAPELASDRGACLLHYFMVQLQGVLEVACADAPKPFSAHLAGVFATLEDEIRTALGDSVEDTQIKALIREIEHMTRLVKQEADEGRVGVECRLAQAQFRSSLETQLVRVFAC